MSSSHKHFTVCHAFILLFLTSIHGDVDADALALDGIRACLYCPPPFPYFQFPQAIMVDIEFPAVETSSAYMTGIGLFV